MARTGAICIGGPGFSQGVLIVSVKLWETITATSIKSNLTRGFCLRYR